MQRLLYEQRAATLADVAWLRKALTRTLTDLRLREELIFDLVLAAAEMLTNAVQHGQPQPTELFLTLDLIGSRLLLSVGDNGGAFGDFGRLWSKATRNSAFVEGEGGRGLPLLREILKNVSYTSGPPNILSGYADLLPHQPTLLILEDDEVQLETYGQLLKRDYRILSAGSLQEGLETISQRRVDLVLADVHLGDGLGTQMLSVNCSPDSEFAVPIILISGDLRAELPREVLMQGAEFFLSKPVKIEHLRETIRLALARTARRQARLAQYFARQVNGLLTPDLPEFLGPHMARFAAGTASVGGGDLILHENCGAFERVVLMDVMGHGISAKAWAIAYASTLRVMLQAGKHESAGAFLLHVAKYLWRQSGFAEILATMMVMDVYPDGEICIACAGHPAPLVLRGGQIEPVEIGGSLIGVFAPLEYPEVRLKLQPGDKIVLFTDGLEPHLQPGRLGSWFATALREAANAGLPDFITSICVAAERELGPQPQDDWTILAVQCG